MAKKAVLDHIQAKNRKLAEIVSQHMYDYVKGSDNKVAGQDREKGARKLLDLSKVVADEMGKYGIRNNAAAAYAFDFNERFNEKPSREAYEIALANVERVSKEDGHIKLLGSGIINNRYGWFVVKH